MYLQARLPLRNVEIKHFRWQLACTLRTRPSANHARELIHMDFISISRNEEQGPLLWCRRNVAKRLCFRADVVGGRQAGSINSVAVHVLLRFGGGMHGVRTGEVGFPNAINNTCLADLGPKLNGECDFPLSWVSGVQYLGA